MKLEFDANNPHEVASVHAMTQWLMGISGDATPARPASPPKAAATSAATPAPTASAPSAGAPAAAPATTSAPTPASAPATDAPAADLPTAQKAFQDYVKANGPAKAKAIIAEFGVTSLAAMPAEQYGAFIARLAA